MQLDETVRVGEVTNLSPVDVFIEECLDEVFYQSPRSLITSFKRWLDYRGLSNDESGAMVMFLDAYRKKSVDITPRKLLESFNKYLNKQGGAPGNDDTQRDYEEKVCPS